MALPLANTFESGQVDTTVITTANSAVGGAAFDSISQSGTSTVTFSTTNVLRGSLAYKFTGDASGSGGSVAWTSTSVGTVTEIWGRAYVYFTALPSVEFRAIGFFNPSRVASLNLRATGAIRASDSLFASADSSYTLLTSTWYRVEFHVLASTTVGSIDANIYLGDSSSSVGSVSKTAANTGSSFNQVSMGQLGGGTPVSFSQWWEDVQINSTGYPGPSTTPSGSVSHPLMMLGVG